MERPELNRGDRGDAVVALQQLLNRTGAMLLVDGDFGRGTDRAVRYAQALAGLPVNGSATAPLWSWLETQPEPFPALPTDGVAFIAREETGGLAYYEACCRWPIFPGASSGITIGVGYDLRFSSAEEFERLWAPHLPASVIDALREDIGRKGSTSRARELKARDVVVPFDAAWAVFTGDSLPDYYAQTEGIYPSLPRLPGLCAATLVSLVYNRGTRLSGTGRREMRAIRDLLAQADDPTLHKLKRVAILSDVEDQLLSMQRLWPPDSGLIRRRQSEANLWRRGLIA